MAPHQMKSMASVALCGFLSLVSVQAMNVGFYYGPKCSHCMSMIKDALIPFVEAGLPGDQVQLTVLPVISNGEIDTNFLAQVCALQTAFPMPTPVANPKLPAALKFVTCCLSQGCASMAAIDQCKSQAPGLEAVDFAACNNQGLNLITQASYEEDPVAGKGNGFASPVPWLVIDGNNLAGQDASVLVPVCEKLPPGTQGCPGGAAPAVTTLSPQAAASAQVAQHKVCENCWEVGSFHWSGSGSNSARHTGQWWNLSLTVAAVGAFASVVGLVALQRGRCGLRDATESQSGETVSEPLHGGDGGDAEQAILVE